MHQEAVLDLMVIVIQSSGAVRIAVELHGPVELLLPITKVMAITQQKVYRIFMVQLSSILVIQIFNI